MCNVCVCVCFYPRGTQRSASWLPGLQKHDVPIVVGVGVSLAFIFITMAFYSLFQNTEPVPVIRAGLGPLSPAHTTPNSPWAFAPAAIP